MTRRLSIYLVEINLNFVLLSEMNVDKKTNYFEGQISNTTISSPSPMNVTKTDTILSHSVWQPMAAMSARDLSSLSKCAQPWCVNVILPCIQNKKALAFTKICSVL